MPVLPLSLLCENALMQNYLQLKDLGDTRYQLIQRVLSKFTAQQLNELEVLNPKLMLDDEDIWLKLLRKEFPQEVHERYTTNSGKIKNFFKTQLDEVNYDYSHLNLDNYIKYQQLGNTKKYKLPSKLIYMKLQQDYIQKEELAIENLRQRMKAIQKDKEQNQVVHIDDIIPVTNTRIKPIDKPKRSKIFMKSQSELKNRQALFRDPQRMQLQRNNQVIRPPRNTPKASTIAPIPTKPVPSPVRSISKSNSPVRPKPQVSIFHRRPTPTRRPTSPSKPSNDIKKDIPIEPPRKKINIGEYKARKL